MLFNSLKFCLHTGSLFKNALRTKSNSNITIGAFKTLFDFASGSKRHAQNSLAIFNKNKGDRVLDYNSFLNHDKAIKVALEFNLP